MRKILFFALVLLTSCTANYQKNQQIVQLDLESNVNGFETVDIFDNIEIIKLDLVTGVVIGNIEKIIEYRDNYYLLESSGVSGARIICINRDGNVLKVLNKHGRGPGEYLYLIDFDLNRNTGELYLLDNYYQKILVYHNDFTFDRKIEPHKPIPLNLISYFEETNSFLINKGNGKTAPELHYNFVELSITGELIDKILPIEAFHSKRLGGYRRSWEVQNEVHFLPPWSNTIYSISRDTAMEFISFTFDKKTLEYESYIANKNLDNVIYNQKFLEGNKHLLFSFLYNSQSYTSIVDKARNKNILIKNENDPTCGCGKLINPICFCGDEIVLLANNLNVKLIIDRIDPDGRKTSKSYKDIETIKTEELEEQILIFSKLK